MEIFFLPSMGSSKAFFKDSFVFEASLFLTSRDWLMYEEWSYTSENMNLSNSGIKIRRRGSWLWRRDRSVGFDLVPPPSVMFPSYNPGTAVWVTCWRCHRASVSPLTDGGHPRFPVTRAHPQPERAPRGPFTGLVWIQSDCDATSSLFGS